MNTLKTCETFHKNWYPAQVINTITILKSIFSKDTIKNEAIYINTLNLFFLFVFIFTKSQNQICLKSVKIILKLLILSEENTLLKYYLTALLLELFLRNLSTSNDNDNKVKTNKVMYPMNFSENE